MPIVERNSSTLQQAENGKVFTPGQVMTSLSSINDSAFNKGNKLSSHVFDKSFAEALNLGVGQENLVKNLEIEMRENTRKITKQVNFHEMQIIQIQQTKQRNQNLDLSL